MESIKKNIEITDKKIGGKGKDKGLEKRHNNNIQMIRNNLPLKRKYDILDLGCREGLFLDRISKNIKWNSLVGMDVSEKAVNYLNSNYRDIIGYTGDIHNLPFEDESFNLVTCLHTLEHCEDPHRVLSEIYRVMKNKGRCLVEVPTENKEKPRTTVGHFSIFRNKDDLLEAMGNYFSILDSGWNPHPRKTWCMCLGRKGKE